MTAWGAVPGTVMLTPPAVEVTVYPLIALPPVFAGADQDTVADMFPPTAEMFAGGSGTATGTTALEGADAGPAPMAFMAVTAKVYEVPVVNPPTVAFRTAPPTVAVAPPGDAVTLSL